jgi:hypothetical protein
MSDTADTTTADRHPRSKAIQPQGQAPNDDRCALLLPRGPFSSSPGMLMSGDRGLLATGWVLRLYSEFPYAIRLLALQRILAVPIGAAGKSSARDVETDRFRVRIG